MSISQWLGQLNYTWVIETVILVAAALLCITFHETCHGFVAYKLGDPTAKRLGRLSLNPLKHVDIAGLLMMAVFKFGWAKPVPVDARYFKNPKRGMAITALAGPLSNLLLALMALVLYYATHFLPVGATWEYLSLFFLYTAILSTGLAVFNILPVPPLDGSKVLLSFLPDRVYEKLLRYEKYGMIILVLLLTSDVLDMPLSFLRNGLLNALSAVAKLPYQLYYSLLS